MFRSAFWKTPVLQSVLPVIEASRHVRTDPDEITCVAGWLAYEPFGWPQAVLPFDIGSDPALLTDYQLLLNTLNFAFSDFATGVTGAADRGGQLDPARGPAAGHSAAGLPPVEDVPRGVQAPSRHPHHHVLRHARR